MTADFLCILESKENNLHWVDWLNENQERRIVFINAEPSLDHPQVKYRSPDTPLQMELLVNEIAREAVFLKLEIIGNGWDPFRKALEKAHREVNLLLSDASDLGCTISKNFFAMRRHPLRDGLGLHQAFRNIPAIIAGAGPSLVKNCRLLETFQSQGFIFAGGSALATLQMEPHFAAAIDKEAPRRQFKRFAWWETPFCCQGRMNPENFSLIHGEAILFPDSHFQMFNEGKTFDSGWTVGTFLTALASFMGCNPIILVGMDLCYQQYQKYAEESLEIEENLIKTNTMDGKEVWTQPDWLMAKSWLENFALKHPGQTFLNATEGGLGFSSPIQNVRLTDPGFKKHENLKSRVHETVAALPFLPKFDWDIWKESLMRCEKIAEKALDSNEENLEGEKVYELLLYPLWQIWSPVFNRSLALDPNPEKLKINRLLFFQNVIQEHLRAIE